MYGGQSFTADDLGLACKVGGYLKNFLVRCPDFNKKAIAIAFMNSYQLNGEKCNSANNFKSGQTIRQYGVSLDWASCAKESLKYDHSIPVSIGDPEAENLKKVTGF